jgi:hypothetical protein
VLTARGGRVFDELAEELSAWRTAPLTAAVLRAAHGAMRARSPTAPPAPSAPGRRLSGRRRRAEIGGAVLHYDGDYDTLAETMALESIWLAPAASLP